MWHRQGVFIKILLRIFFLERTSFAVVRFFKARLRRLYSKFMCLICVCKFYLILSQLTFAHHTVSKLVIDRAYSMLELGTSYPVMG
jgi:poly(A) polymerase Pap1